MCPPFGTFRWLAIFLVVTAIVVSNPFTNILKGALPCCPHSPDAGPCEQSIIRHGETGGSGENKALEHQNVDTNAEPENGEP